MADDRPYVSIAPGMQSGQPTLNGTRLTVEAVAGMVWVDGVDVAAECYEITRADVLVCCWFAGIYGLPGRRKPLAAVPAWRRRWGGWAAEVHGMLWAGNCDKVPDPPTAAAGLPEETPDA